MNQFNLWAGACAHIHTDLDRGDRESFASAIRHSEGRGPANAPRFDWDIMVHLGDLNRGHPTPPTDDDGEELHRQWGSMRDHRREQIYNLLGNHDANGPEEPTQWWFKKWVDPLGEHSENSGVDPDHRPFPITGNWERYSFEAGNILFLMMGDRNDLDPPIGRSQYEEGGGFPAGAVTEETFKWWRRQVEENQEMIIVTCHHHMLKDTTVASGRWEGIMGNYHGYIPEGAPEGSSYLYFVGEDPDSNRFEEYLRDNPGAIDLWLGGHTHALPGDTFGGKRHVERKWETTFVNVAPMTRYHGNHDWGPGSTSSGLTFAPLTRHLRFEAGKRTVKIRCYLHTDDLQPIGWYEDETRRVPLRHQFAGLNG